MMPMSVVRSRGEVAIWSREQSVGDRSRLWEHMRFLESKVRIPDRVDDAYRYFKIIESDENSVRATRAGEAEGEFFAACPGQAERRGSRSDSGGDGDS